MKNIDLNNIYNTDAISLMKKMKLEKIRAHLILTDPPYNISRENNFKTIGRKGIDFGSWDKNFNQISWLKYVPSILKEGGSIIIFNDWKNMGLISKELEKLDFSIKDLIRWVKPAPMPRNVNRRYVSDYEVAIWAVKNSKSNKTWTFNKQNEIPYLRPEINGSTPRGGQNSPNPKITRGDTTINKCPL